MTQFVCDLTTKAGKKRGGGWDQGCDKVLTPHVVFCFSFAPLFPHAFWMTHACSSSFPLPTHTRFTQGVKRGDGGGRETQKEKTGEETAQQGTVLVCGNHHTHVGKTRQDMGMDKGKKDVGHTRGKGREKTRRGSPKDTHHTEKEKKAKDNEHLKTIKSIA